MECEAETMTHIPFPIIEPENALLKATSLQLGYDRQVLLHSVNLYLEKGKLTSLVGPNGAGKSTLLRTLSGLQTAMGGSIYLEGKALSDFSAAALAKTISLVLTQKNTLGMITVQDLVALGRSPYTAWHGQLRKKDWIAVQEALERVNMTSFMHRMVEELSDGERQKVMIARALAQDTPIILLDEPTAHLDLSNRLEIFQLLNQLAHELDKSILISTHELSLAVQLSGALWLINQQQRRLHTGIPEDLVLNNNISHAFPKVGFNWNSTNFLKVSYPKPTYTPVYVEGDHLGVSWTQQCLRRLGYPIGNKHEAQYCIEMRRYDDYHYEWHCNGYSFNKLMQLLNYMAAG